MRNIAIYTILSLFLFSCQESLLETVPDDRISTEIFWETEDDAIFGANAIYPTLDGNKVFAYDGITDLFHTNRTFENNSIIEAGNADASFSRFQTEWDDAYTAIRRANDFFENVDRVETSNTELISRLKGEVRTIRAFHYAKLVMLYGDVPLITTSIDVQEGKSLTRSSAESIWDYVETELTTAVGELPVSYTGNDLGRVTKGAALALKARAMLYAGRYDASASAAKQVMDLGVYSLYNSYGDLFQYEGENCNEVILSRQYAKDVLPNNYYHTLGPWSLVPGSVGSVYVPTKKLVDLYEMKNGLPISDPESGFDPENPYENRDPRLKQSIFVTGETLPDGGIFNSIPGDADATDPVGGTLYTTTTGWNVKKYIASDDFNTPKNSGINLVLIRYAEVLLTYAEAKIELNQIDQSVYDAINEVRGRVSVEMPPIADGLSQGQLREVVRKERAIELAFEGTRLFDIRRWEIVHEVMPGEVYGMTYSAGGELVTIKVESYNRVFDQGRDYLWPIPQRERELNPNLEQNPKW